jgi:rubrerythrin
MEENPMTIEEAIKTALQYEHRVVAVYEEAARSSLDPTGKRVFSTLVEEEKKHVEYLEDRLREWRETGRVQRAVLSTVVPSPARIEDGIAKLKGRVATEAKDSEVRLLKHALDVEVETSRFYEEVVKELPPEGRGLFERFVEIEHGHQAIVQAEMDCVSGSGFWFDMQEFTMDGG